MTMNKKNTKVMILAGGSGGHIYPALAVAEVLNEKGVEIVWLGTKAGLEGRISFPDYIDNEWIEMKGVTGKGIASWLTMPFRLLSAVIQAMKILKKHQPDLVFGTGGFVAAPGGVAAFIKRVPLVIHESNAIAGITNKWLSKIATKTLVAIADTKGIAGNTVLVGNPVRKALVELLNVNKNKIEDTNVINISIIGGSQGAQIFNEILPEALGSIKSHDLHIRHQTGGNKLTGVAEAYSKANFNNKHKVEVFEYVDNMAELYNSTDIVICRAGAMTIAEIALARLPAIIVPLPNSSGGHQLANAKYYQKQMAGVLIEQDQFSANSMQQVIEMLLAAPDKLNQMALQAKNMAEPNAAEKAAKECWEIIHA